MQTSFYDGCKEIHEIGLGNELHEIENKIYFLFAVYFSIFILMCNNQMNKTLFKTRNQF